VSGAVRRAFRRILFIDERSQLCNNPRGRSCQREQLCRHGGTVVVAVACRRLCAVGSWPEGRRWRGWSSTLARHTRVCVFFLVVFTCEWTASPIIMAALSQRSYVNWLAMCFYFLAVVFNADASASMIFTTPSGLYYLSLK
jgi:hypothetical protein